MPSTPDRFVPRFVMGGVSNKVLSTTAAYIGGVVLTSKTASASLNIYARGNTASSWNSSLERVLKVYAKSPSASISPIFGGPFLCPTGIGVSLSGAGAVATILIAFKNK